MRWILAIPLILFGAFLFSLTIDSIGEIGNIILNIVGFGFLLVGAIVGRRKKEQQS
ncbi:LPXTG cell wall anchor domain-containing protein [Halalkalibacter flavus]|uniref:LPXTG cell wall anchor domain-containing protein n=1 Tax=Halalkalibacter flavus TaxID=3090668 RepID=UPI002FCBA772